MKNTIEQNKLIKEYILNSIQVTEDMSDKDKLQALYDTFKAEYLNEYELKRYGNEVKVFEQYILGLPSIFDIHYEFYEIEKQLREWNIIHEGDNQKRVDMIKMNWHSYIANRVFTLMSRAKINKGL